MTNIIELPKDLLRLTQDMNKALAQEAKYTNLCDHHTLEEKDAKKAKRYDALSYKENKKIVKALKEIMAYPDNSLAALVIKARLMEQYTNLGIINGLALMDDPSLEDVMAHNLARSLEKQSGIATPAPQDKIADVLYGFGGA